MNDNYHDNNTVDITAKRLSSLLLSAFILALLTVVVSSYIRLAESGVGCEPWSECYGTYKTDTNTRGINVFKQQGEQAAFRVERIFHRLIASTLGILIVVLFFLSRRRDYSHKTGKFIPGFLLLLTLILAVLGPLQPVNPLPIITLSNFTGGLLMMTLLYYLYQKVTRPATQKGKVEHLWFLRLGLVVLLLQIFWGGWTSANYAGPACDRLLSCNISGDDSTVIAGIVNPLVSLELDQQSKVVIKPKMYTIQLIHHLLAVLSLVIFILITVLQYLNKLSDNKKLRNNCLFVMSIILLQFIIGLVTVTFGLPLAILTMHNLLAALLLILMTSLYMKLPMRSEL